MGNVHYNNNPHNENDDCNCNKKVTMITIRIIT